MRGSKPAGFGKVWGSARRAAAAGSCQISPTAATRGTSLLRNRISAPAKAYKLEVGLCLWHLRDVSNTHGMFSTSLPCHLSVSQQLSEQVCVTLSSMEEIYQPTVFFGWRVFRARWMEMDDEMTTMWKRVTAKKPRTIWTRCTQWRSSLSSPHEKLHLPRADSGAANR